MGSIKITADDLVSKKAMKHLKKMTKALTKAQKHYDKFNKANK